MYVLLWHPNGPTHIFPAVSLLVPPRGLGVSIGGGVHVRVRVLVLVEADDVSQHDLFSYFYVYFEHGDILPPRELLRVLY